MRPAVVFLLALAAYSAVAAGRLAGRSPAPHFVLLADAWLHGRLDVARWPPGTDDPAVVETVRLRDGSTVQGRRLRTRPVFRAFGGEEIPLARVAGTVKRTVHVSFPPFPAILFLPFVALFGTATNDVVLTAILAALAPALLLVLLRRLREEGWTTRTPREELWLAALLAFGTVFFYSAVQGRVWYTAHVVGVDLALLFLLAATGARRPLLAGCLLGCAFLTRASMLFLFPYFVLEARRAARGRFVAVCARFALPIALVGLAAAWHNQARFGEPLEFGHRYLQVRQAAQIEELGLFSPAYLARNVKAAFGLLPRPTASAPFLRISGHGLAIWFTTPALLLLLRKGRRGPLAPALWAAVAATAVWPLLYQNTGWFQFGYRFALDFMVPLIVLLAVDPRPLGRVARGLIVVGILINLFGAVTFHRFDGFYATDLATYRSLG